MLERIRKPLKNLIDICDSYKSDNIDIVAFQKELETIYLPPETSYELLCEQHDTHNHLERIRFFNAEEDHREQAIPFVNDLIAATEAELKRLKSYRPYATPAL